MVKKRPGIANTDMTPRFLDGSEDFHALDVAGRITNETADGIPLTDAPVIADVEHTHERAKSFEELDAELAESPHGGRMEFNSIEDLNPEDFETSPENDVPELDLAEIAEIAHNTLVNYHNIMFPKKEPLRYYLDLGDDEKTKLTNETFEIMQTAANPNDEDLARLKHAHFAMNLLAAGYKFAVEEDDSEKETPLVMPWEYLPNAHKMRFMMFRDVARRLVKAVWSGR